MGSNPLLPEPPDYRRYHPTDDPVEIAKVRPGTGSQTDKAQDPISAMALRSVNREPDYQHGRGIGFPNPQSSL